MLGELRRIHADLTAVLYEHGAAKQSIAHILNLFEALTRGERVGIEVATRNTYEFR
jgi:hypothetical protein